MLIFLWIVCSVIIYVFIECSYQKIIAIEKQIPIFYRLVLAYLILVIVSLLTIKNIPIIQDANIIRAFMVSLGIICICWYVVPRIKCKLDKD